MGESICVSHDFRETLAGAVKLPMFGHVWVISSKRTVAHGRNERRSGAFKKS
jgi:hypothetical protein